MSGATAEDTDTLQTAPGGVRKIIQEKDESLWAELRGQRVIIGRIYPRPTLFVCIRSVSNRFQTDLPALVFFLLQPS